MKRFHKFLLCFCCAAMLICINPIYKVYAAGSDANNPYNTDFVFSYWNIDNVYATTADGRQMLFEFPTDFFYKTQITTEYVALQSVDGVHTLDLRFNGTVLNGVKYMAIEMVTSSNNSLYTKLEFTFLNNVIYNNNALVYDVNIPLDWRVPLFEIYDLNRTNDITLNTVQSLNSIYSVVSPNPRDDGSVGFDRSFGSILTISSTVIDYQTFYNLLIPQSVMDNAVSSFVNNGYTRIDTIPYFDYARCTINLDDSYAMNSLFTIYLPVGQCSQDLDYSVGNTIVSKWYDKYANFSAFPGYPESDLDYGLEEITDFVATIGYALFGFEIFPGITIGGIVFAIFGIAFVRSAINFFAGG